MIGVRCNAIDMECRYWKSGGWHVTSRDNLYFYSFVHSINYAIGSIISYRYENFLLSGNLIKIDIKNLNFTLEKIPDAIKAPNILHNHYKINAVQFTKKNFAMSA